MSATGPALTPPASPDPASASPHPAPMILDMPAIQPVVDAVLYEGYILYPYRPTSVKNRQRWTFGGIYPRSYHDATGGSEPFRMQTQCLLRGDDDTRLEVRVRFLHPVARELGVLDPPMAAWPVDGEPAFRRVPSLQVGERELHSWQEAMERDVLVADCRLGTLRDTERRTEFAFDSRRELAPLTDDDGTPVGVLLHRQVAVQGCITVRADPVADDCFRLTVRIENLTTTAPDADAGRDQASLYSFASTHTLLGTRGGAFVSSIDPPPALAAAVAACDNQGAYPVLVGRPGAHDAMLSSPIILYDHPEIAPESPGDLFDATEIDEILSLRILTMTDAEKREMVATDPRAAALLARTEALDGDALMQLHGTMREPRDAADSGARAADSRMQRPPPPRLAACNDGGRQWRVGERVR
ncbi:MAG: hypothetical protein M3414_02310, partial [Pseudomonadota bacterium]|nr:hypothetical protein [Pseudomonadota bacterium]